MRGYLIFIKNYQVLNNGTGGTTPNDFLVKLIKETNNTKIVVRKSETVGKFNNALIFLISGIFGVIFSFFWMRVLS